jgi:hypothetical protein
MWMCCSSRGTSLGSGVVQHNALAKKLVEEACGGKILDPNYTGIVFLDGKHVLGAGVFTNYWPDCDVEYTATLFDGMVGMRIARIVARHVFVTMNCHRCTAITRRDNIKAQTALAKIGFMFEGVMREHFPGRVDGYVFGLLRSEQRLIKGLK